MAQALITEEMKRHLERFLKGQKHPELVNTYLFFIEKNYKLQPVLFPKEKKIYQSSEEAVRLLDKDGKIWKETEIKIAFGNQGVNEETKKIYICPFSGKVFGDNTHPNPQDAIYDWVSRCPENKETVGGLKSKRFLVSEDPGVILSYAAKTKIKEPITKVVYSSVTSGKLFNSKEAVIEDFKKNYLKRLTLVEVQNQNRFEIEDHFLAFIQSQLTEDQISSFVESLSEYEEFSSYIEQWVE